MPEINVSPPKTKKKKYVIRRRVTDMEVKSPSHKVIVARKIKAGQTIECSNKKIELPRSNSLSQSKVEMLPQSLAVYNDDFAGPPVDHTGKLIDWGMLGEPEDFLEYELAKTGKSYEPPKPPHKGNVVVKLDPLTARTMARETEARLEREKLAKMLPEDRIIATSNHRALQKWEKINEDWDKFKKKMIKKLNTSEGSLLVSTTDDFRAKAETYDLIGKSVPIWNKYGAIHWQMTLRNETSHFVPLGNEFSGLYCKIGEPTNPRSESIRRPSKYTSVDDINHSTWRDSEFLHTRIKQLGKRMNALQPNFSGQLAALERPVKDQNPLGDLKIVGTDLFANDDDEKVPEEDEVESQEKIMTPELQVHKIQVDHIGTIRHPEGVVMMGPNTEVVTERVMLTCKLGGVASANADFVNVGSTSLAFEWKVRPKSSDEPSDDIGSVMWCAAKGTLLPGQKAQIPFLFIPNKPGTFLETLELHTTPALTDDYHPTLFFKGVCDLPDDNTVVRRDLDTELTEAHKENQADLILDDVMGSVKEPMPDEHFHRYLFYTKNLHNRLHYYKDNCRAFCKLALEVFACHKRAVRSQAVWDFSTDGLKNWIKTIPFRNSHKIEGFTQRFDTLVKEASIRPAPDQTRYDMMSYLLSSVIANVHRLAKGHRADIGILKPLPHVAVQIEKDRLAQEEEERLKNDPKARRAAAKKAKQAAKAPKLSGEAAEKKAAEEAEAAAARAEERKGEIVLEEERATQEADYRERLGGDIKDLLSSIFTQFDGLTIPVDDLPSANTAEENAANEARMAAQAEFVPRMKGFQSRPTFHVHAWGNGITFPALGEVKEDPNDKKKKKKKKKLKKGEVEVIIPKSALEEKEVVLCSASSSHAIGFTTDNFYYLIKNPDPTMAAKGAKKPGGKTSSRGTTPGGTLVDDKPGDLPKSIPALQGYKAVDLACAPSSCLIVTEDGGFYVYDLESQKVTEYLKDQHVTACAVSQDGANMFAVTLDGGLWSMGENTKIGLLGHNDKNKLESFKLIKALEGVQIVSVACATQSAVCLAKDGTVYGWGEAFGAGIGDKKPKGAPEVIPALTPQALSAASEAADEEKKKEVEVSADSERVVQVVCGAYVTLARTSKGRVFSWGKGVEGNLGSGDNKDRDVPEEIKNLGGVTSLAAGEGHSMAMCNDGIYTWGRGANGSLGHGNNENLMVPTLMDKVDNYVKIPVGICAGGNFSLGYFRMPAPPE